MIIFRFVCAALMAWAISWALSRNEAIALLEAFPEIDIIGPVAGAIIGFFNLAVRQGWGFIVAFANGIWAGVLSIVVSGVVYIGYITFDGLRTNTVQDFDNFMTLFSDTMGPMLSAVADVPLLVVSFGATAVVGVITEVIHWVLVRMRGKRKSSGQS